MPELAQAVNAGTAGDEINTTQWEDISIGALASHMAGMARNDGQTGLLSTTLPWPSLRCPELTASKLPSLFLQDPIKHQLIFPPSTTSIHSSGAFPLLCFALESITNKSFTDMMNNLFTQLDYLRLPTRHPLFSIRSQSIEYCIQWLGPKRSRS